MALRPSRGPAPASKPRKLTMWLRNCWYVIAWDHEIPAAGSRDLFSRTVLNEPILVFRREDGALAARVFPDSGDIRPMAGLV